MTGETSNESTSKEAASMAPGLLSNPPNPAKVNPVAALVLPQGPVFLYSNSMPATELLENINKKWEACWPIDTLRPLVLLDLLSYLLFIKKLEEKQLLAGALTETPGGNIFHSKEKDELSWSKLKNMDPQSLHQLFIKENGIPDLLKSYSRTNLPYSLFVKEPLLLTPTARLLANILEIIKIMEAEDSGTRASIFEYLLHKTEITAQNGQVYAPDYAVKLMVALMRPVQDDVIGDPSSGNGSFLVNSAMYIANKNAAAGPDLKNNLIPGIYKGIECDLIQLRIGAMNMILHGIEEPKLEGLNIFSKANLSLREQPTLIFSNLFFEGTEDKTAKANVLQPEARSHEIRLLTLILKSLRSNGRAALIVREIILYDNITEIKTIRRQIIDDLKVEAVISLPVKTGSPFSGACILILTKPASGTTDKVWFYKMDSKKDDVNTKSEYSKKNSVNDVFSFAGEYDDVQDILTRWKDLEKESSRKRTDKSFYVPVDEIKANNYNLGFKEYRGVPRESRAEIQEESPIRHTAVVPVNLIREDIQQQAEPVFKKIKSPSALPVAPVRRTRSTIFVSLVVIFSAAIAFYFIFRNKDDKTISSATRDNFPGKTKSGQPTPQPVTDTPATGMLSREQIKAILKDTTGIIHFNDQPVNATPTVKEPAKKPAAGNADNLAGKKTVQPPIPAPVAVAPENALKMQYTVLDTTFFHDQPNESSRRKSYLDPLNNNVLKPIQDSNGFIFIVYTNHSGRTSKGWINKKDLKPVR